jgi:hypothetical protein
MVPVSTLSNFLPASLNLASKVLIYCRTYIIFEEPTSTQKLHVTFACTDTTPQLLSDNVSKHFQLHPDEPIYDLQRPVDRYLPYLWLDGHSRTR